MNFNDLMLWVQEDDFMAVKHLTMRENRARLNPDMKPLVMTLSAVSPAMIDLAGGAGIPDYEPGPG